MRYELHKTGNMYTSPEHRGVLKVFFAVLNHTFLTLFTSCSYNSIIDRFNHG